MIEIEASKMDSLTSNLTTPMSRCLEGICMDRSTRLYNFILSLSFSFFHWFDIYLRSCVDRPRPTVFQLFAYEYSFFHNVYNIFNTYIARLACVWWERRSLVRKSVPAMKTCRNGEKVNRKIFFGPQLFTLHMQICFGIYCFIFLTFHSVLPKGSGGFDILRKFCRWIFGGKKFGCE